MKHAVICLVLLIKIQIGFTQERPYVQFNYTLPESFQTAYETDKLLVYNKEKRICVIIYSPYKAGSNIAENFIQLWNTPQKNIEGYFGGDVYKRNTTKVNGYQMMSGELEGESNSQVFKKTIQLYQDGNSCNAVIAFVDKEQTNSFSHSGKACKLFKKQFRLPRSNVPIIGTKPYVEPMLQTVLYKRINPKQQSTLQDFMLHRKPICKGWATVYFIYGNCLTWKQFILGKRDLQMLQQ